MAVVILTGNALVWKPSPNVPYNGLRLTELGSRFLPNVFKALSGDHQLGYWFYSFIVSADVNTAVVAAKTGLVHRRNSWPTCVSVKRIYVHELVRDWKPVVALPQASLLPFSQSLITRPDRAQIVVEELFGEPALHPYSIISLLAYIRALVLKWLDESKLIRRDVPASLDWELPFGRWIWLKLTV
ncbi:hypothetical protein GGS21DRAFT_491262 [Xylaria nigripes]|nr:hypothetical protein GGS21DRAFT_491262 [Xylaria nigripes]